MCRSKTLWGNNLETYPVGKGFEREKPTRYAILFIIFLNVDINKAIYIRPK